MKNIIKNQKKHFDTDIKKIIFLFLIINLFDEKFNLNFFEKKDSLIKLKKKLYLSSEIIKIYSTLYDTYKNGYTKPTFPKMKERYYPINKQKSGVCICSICKKENLYIREFVQYHFLLGVNKIIIYDNNDINGEELEKLLENYIKKKFVDIIDVRGLSSIQIPIFNFCYQNNKKFYDWIAFLDIDEYIFIKNNVNFNNYIYNKRFEKCELIFLNWMIYNDNDLIKYENKSLSERFKNPKCLFNQGKSLIRGGFTDLIIPSTHIPGINIHYFCNSNGKRIYPKNFYGNIIDIDSKAFIKHYYTKTVEEFCRKIKKGNAHFHKEHPNYIETIKNRINLFFTFNKITNKKIKILEKCIRFKLNNSKKIMK